MNLSLAIPEAIAGVILSNDSCGRQKLQYMNQMASRNVTVPGNLSISGCNLDRDIVAVIEGEFEWVEVTEFDLSVGLLVTFPNVVGVARDSG